MCIIVAKPAGVPMPETSILEQCFQSNGDGAGLMYASEGCVYGCKGFMDFPSFMQVIDLLRSQYGDLTPIPMVLHFRLATHGGIIPENTQPLPVSEFYEDLRDLSWGGRMGIAHNGIISYLSGHPDIKSQNVSDSMVFIRRVVAPIVARVRAVGHRDLWEALHVAADSKLAVMFGDGHIRCLGDFIEDNGVFYSNESYKANSYYPYIPLDDDDSADWIMDEFIMQRARDLGLTPLGVFPTYAKIAARQAVDSAERVYYWDDDVWDWIDTGITKEGDFLDEP